MPSLSRNLSITDFQKFVQEVYGLSNDRNFGMAGMFSNMQRFAMRALKGIRKNDYNKTKVNLLITLSWFMSTLSRFHINLEEEVWKRFPYVCSYCAECPCSCKEHKIQTRQKILGNESKRPKTLEEFQTMFGKIYPPEARTLEHAGVHLAEELGEFSEAITAYRGEHKPEQFAELCGETADVFSCLIGVFNSSGINVAEELSNVFSENCHECKRAPCECDYSFVMNYKS